MGINSMPRLLTLSAFVLVFSAISEESFADAPACFMGVGVSAGSSKDLREYRAPYKFALPRNAETGKQYRPEDIVGMGLDGENNYNFAWYKDGYVSAGTSEDLGKFRKPYKVERAPAVNVGPSDVVGIGIDGENDWIFVWFVGKDSKLC
ncbi:MAG: hypothetical protein L0387_46010 [Acidobacteria bacterium]|nr:hypothetical protein [Acidobacteriota bacterium]